MLISLLFSFLINHTSPKKTSPFQQEVQYLHPEDMCDPHSPKTLWNSISPREANSASQQDRETDKAEGYEVSQLPTLVRQRRLRAAGEPQPPFHSCPEAPVSVTYGHSDAAAGM